jgi:hypothetical protein
VSRAGCSRLADTDASGASSLFPLLKRYLAAGPRCKSEVSYTDRRADLDRGGLRLAIRIGARSRFELVSRVVAAHRGHVRRLRTLTSRADAL